MSEPVPVLPECGVCGISQADHYGSKCPINEGFSPNPSPLMRRLKAALDELSAERARANRLQRMIDDPIAQAVAADRAVRRAREADAPNISKAWRRLKERL